MIKSILRNSSKTLIVLVLGGVAGSFVGCGAPGAASLLTYAQESRQKGLKQFEANDYENAAGSFQSATRQDPRDYKSFYYLGASYDKLGSHQQAAQAYESSLKVMDVTLEGKSDKAFRAKTIDGLAIAIAKGHDRTSQLAMPAPGKKPAEDAWLRAKVNRYLGDADAAMEAYTQAALSDPNDFYIAKDHALYLAELGQNQAADVQLRRAYRMKSDDPEIAEALRKIGTVPGPALKSQRELATPPIPRGPIPELQLPKFGNGNTPAATGAEPAPTPPNPNFSAPRD